MQRGSEKIKIYLLIFFQFGNFVYWYEIWLLKNIRIVSFKKNVTRKTICGPLQFLKIHSFMTFFTYILPGIYFNRLINLLFTTIKTEQLLTAINNQLNLEGLHPKRITLFISSRSHKNLVQSTQCSGVLIKLEHF
ncbi:hypothetical protein BpHYR1_018645 [Brachionus plicatilis]|uniref:Uncharacterized protein n=1 Tax=Brachionus plicatilis TaxID=10195 RepID=A0A3M7PUJ7_BRAPC|nr:hypothetical protein BpHYR1_018645 [Brachionus plicatilis]